MKGVHHLTSLISFVRHGEKDETGALTRKGLEQALKKGAKMRFLKGKTHLRHSGVGRVEKTARAVAEMLPFSYEDEVDRHVREVVDDGLGEGLGSGMNHPVDQMNELHYVIDGELSSDYFAPWNKTLPIEESMERMDGFLKLGDESPEPGIVPSPKEMAQRVGRVVLDELEIVETTDHKHKENFINTSHEPVLMSFLYYGLQDFDPKVKNFSKEVGGSLGFVEGFDVNVYQSRQGKVALFLEFRDLLVELEKKQLSDFVGR